MIQRIQSLYLLLTIVLFALVFFLPVWSWTATDGNLYYNFSPFGVRYEFQLAALVCFLAGGVRRRRIDLGHLGPFLFQKAGAPNEPHRLLAIARGGLLRRAALAVVLAVDRFAQGGFQSRTGHSLPRCGLRALDLGFPWCESRPQTLAFGRSHSLKARSVNRTADNMAT